MKKIVVRQGKGSMGWTLDGKTPRYEYIVEYQEQRFHAELFDSFEEAETEALEVLGLMKKGTW